LGESLARTRTGVDARSLAALRVAAGRREHASNEGTRAYSDLEGTEYAWGNGLTVILVRKINRVSMTNQGRRKAFRPGFRHGAARDERKSRRRLRARANR
jgi:hypothetical protein